MMRRDPQKDVVNDKIVWVLGANGVQAPKKLSAIQYRVDVQILGDYVEGDKCYNDPDNKPKVTRKPKATKAPEEKKE